MNNFNLDKYESEDKIRDPAKRWPVENNASFELFNSGYSV